MNILESLRNLDKKSLDEETTFYDLVSLYEGLDLSDKEKEELAKKLESEDAEVVYDYLYKKFDGEDEDEVEFVDNRKNSIIRGDDDFGFDEYDLKESKLNEAAHEKMNQLKGKNESLKEDYWMNQERIDKIHELEDELKADGYQYSGYINSGSADYDIYKKFDQKLGKGVWKAIKYREYSIEPQIVDITYDQALGREPLDSFHSMRMNLGKMLLPHRESLTESSDDKYFIIATVASTTNDDIDLIVGVTPRGESINLGNISPIRDNVDRREAERTFSDIATGESDRFAFATKDKANNFFTTLDRDIDPRDGTLLKDKGRIVSKNELIDILSNEYNLGKDSRFDYSDSWSFDESLTEAKYGGTQEYARLLSEIDNDADYLQHEVKEKSDISPADALEYIHYEADDNGHGYLQRSFKDNHEYVKYFDFTDYDDTFGEKPVKYYVLMDGKMPPHYTVTKMKLYDDEEEDEFVSDSSRRIGMDEELNEADTSHLQRQIDKAHSLGNEDIAYDLFLVLTNSGDSYNKTIKPAIDNLKKKAAKGILDDTQAVQLFYLVVENALNDRLFKQYYSYDKSLVDVPTRYLTAEKLYKKYEEQIKETDESLQEGVIKKIGQVAKKVQNVATKIHKGIKNVVHTLDPKTLKKEWEESKPSPDEVRKMYKKNKEDAAIKTQVDYWDKSIDREGAGQFVLSGEETVVMLRKQGKTDQEIADILKQRNKDITKVNWQKWKAEMANFNDEKGKQMQQA